MSELSSGKGHKDENFPVASALVAAEHRAPIMAFYRFARAADDIADHPTASEQEKLARLAEMRAGLDGTGAPEAEALARVQKEHGIDPTHANDLLDAFVQDVTVRRYATWDDLIAYCRLSAMPVGRFVLDVHGEDRAVWPRSDALCAALQVINHLQDCGKDYRALDRVYLPTDLLDRHGGRIEDLAAMQASPGLRATIVDCAERSLLLLNTSAPFANAIRAHRLACEVAVIQRLAADLCALLLRRDPLNERVHHNRMATAWHAIAAIVGQLSKRLTAGGAHGA